MVTKIPIQMEKVIILVYKHLLVIILPKILSTQNPSYSKITNQNIPINYSYDYVDINTNNNLIQ